MTRAVAKSAQMLYAVVRSPFGFVGGTCDHDKLSVEYSSSRTGVLPFIGHVVTWGNPDDTG